MTSWTLLVVDDNHTNRLFVQAALEPEGYHVEQAVDGVEALEMAQRLHPSLILLDVRMPGMDGFEVCAALKGMEQTRHIPVIFLTGTEEPDAEQKAFAAGGADFINKPLRVSTLLARVRTHVALHAQRRSLEGMFRDVLEFAPVAFLFADSDGTVVNANALAARQLGYARAALAGLHLSVLIPAYAEKMAPMLDTQSISGTEERGGVELQCHRHDGSEFPAEALFARLDTPRGALLTVVFQDISERKRMLSERDESRRLIRNLAAQREATREQERKHIAREVHDELGQVLTALRMDVALLRRQYQAQTPGLSEKLDGMRSLVDRAIADVRDIAGHLRPAALDMGLHAAVEWLRDEFVRQTGVTCTVENNQPGFAMDETRSIVVYRIVQESLNNIAKYAAAIAVHIAIAIDVVAGRVALSVTDDGVGFDMEARNSRPTYGLLGMRERALVLGGTLAIRSAPTKGTRIFIDFPILSPDAGGAA